MKPDPSPTARYLKFFSLSLCLALAFGCSTSPFVQAPALTENAIVGESQGYLVAKIINAGNVALPFNHLYITPINLNESEEVQSTELHAVNMVAGRSSLFASPVEAGKYSLSFVSSFHSNGNYWYSRAVKGGLELGTFEVIAGETTDLGNLIYYPKSHGDRYTDTILRSPSGDNRRFIHAALPFFDYDIDQSHTWHDDEHSDERRAAYNSAVQNPVSYGNRFIAADGSVYFLGQLGALLARNTSGEWTFDAVDTDLEMNAIDENNRGDIALGGEYGSLFVKLAGKAWKKLEIDPAYSVQAVRFYDDDHLDVILSGVFNLKVLRKNLASAADDWIVMASYTPRLGWLDGEDQQIGLGMLQTERDHTPRFMEYARVFERSKKHYLFMGVQVGKMKHAFNTKKHKKLTFDPASWKVSLSNGFEKGIDRVLDAGAIELGIKEAGVWSWDGRDDYLRFDPLTNEWVEISTRIDRCIDGSDLRGNTCPTVKRSNAYARFNFLSVPVFFSEREAIAFVRIPAIRDEEKSVRVLETIDGGATWTVSQKKPPSKYCLGTVPEAKGVLLVSCIGASSDFYESRDRGETWQHVREHESF